MLSYTDIANANYQNYDHAAHVAHIRDRVRFLRMRQPASPRFMYANGEIIKRGHAIGFDVSTFVKSDSRAPAFDVRHWTGYKRACASPGGRFPSSNLATDRCKW